jgi:2-oxoglutarate ferredoxin oxidoreductase subunit beta
MQLALSAGATFIARGYAGDNKQETHLLTEAIKHKGFSIVDTMQPCVTFNHHNTFAWFYERIYKLEDENHDPSNKIKAFERAEEWPLRRPLNEGEKERVALGIFYKEDRPTWEDGIPQIAKTPLIKHEVGKPDITPLLKEMM